MLQEIVILHAVTLKDDPATSVTILNFLLIQDEVDEQHSLVRQAFSRRLTFEKLSLWLSNHPDIGPDYKQEIDTLKGSKVHKYCEVLNKVFMLWI